MRWPASPAGPGEYYLGKEVFYFYTDSIRHALVHAQKSCRVGKCVMFEQNGQQVLLLASQLAEIDATSSSVSPLTLYRLQLVACLSEVVSLPPADEKSNHKHNVVWLFSVRRLLSPLNPSLQTHFRVVSHSYVDWPGSAVAVGDKCGQPQLLLRFTQGLPCYHHHFIGTLTVHNQTSGNQHDCQRQASR